MMTITIIAAETARVDSLCARSRHTYLGGCGRLRGGADDDDADDSVHR